MRRRSLAVDETNAAAEYARAVERLLEGSDDRPLIVSRADFEKIAAWWHKGIPLAFLEEQWRELQRSVRLRRGRAPRFTNLARAVDEAWVVVREGRRTPDPDDGVESGSRSPESNGKSSMDVQQGVSAIDGRDRPNEHELAQLAPTELLAAIRAEVDDELRPFRSRMTAEAMRSTTERAVADRLRRRLNFPRTSRTEVD